MKCQQVQELLFAFLDRRLSDSERILIQTHLATCPVCQREMTVLSTLQNYLHQSLNNRAAQAVPSSRAWDRLSESLVRQSPSRRLGGLGLIHRRLALAGFLALLLAFVAILGLSRQPVGTGQGGLILSPAILSGRVSGTPRCLNLQEVQSRIDFPIRLPKYLPKGYKQASICDQGAIPEVVIIFSAASSGTFDLYETRDQRFLKPSAVIREVSVNGRPAYWAPFWHPLLPGMPTAVPAPPSGSATPDYQAISHSLSWEDIGVIYHMQSFDLSLEEMLRVAESLR